MSRWSRFKPDVPAIAKQVAKRPWALLVVPLATGLAYGFGRDDIALLSALILPLLLAAAQAVHLSAEPKFDSRTHDRLTGLPSRAKLIDTLDHSIAHPAPGQPLTACIVLDLDGFHRFNNIWGKSSGNALLVACADRITSALRMEDMVCRLDADAFAVFLSPTSKMTSDTVLAITERIQRDLSAALVINGTTCFASASVGVALLRQVQDPTGAKLLAAAERAMLEARDAGCGMLRVYSEDMDLHINVDPDLTADVIEALDAGDITPWFQPQISTDGDRVSGMEALARWVHPKRGPVPPSQFLPAIVACGRGERLSELVITGALRMLRDWDAEGLHVPSIGVNFAAAELRHPRLVDRIRWELDRFGLVPDRLAVEVLETVVARDENDILLRNLADLHDLGCRIDLDDFGTGSAGISAIRRFHVGRIKIDRSFVTRLDREPDQSGMVRAMIALARQMKVEVLAEGVETQGEEAALKRMGCDHLQGFSVARPMSPKDATAWLRSQDRVRTHKNLQKQA